MHIQFVKKILADGSPCKKCMEVSERLKQDGVAPLIDQTVIADQRDPQSPGMVLAEQHQVERAPFFIIEDEHGKVEVFDVYFKFRKQLTELGLLERASVSL